MIWRPRVGMRVRIHYGKPWAKFMPAHGQMGVVEAVAAYRRRVPLNAAVRLDDGRLVGVPRGNLILVDDERSQEDVRES